MGRICDTYGRERDFSQGLIEKLVGKRSPGRHRCMWGVISKWILEKLIWRMEWIHMAHINTTYFDIIPF
jgi:hypothetical protein